MIRAPKLIPLALAAAAILLTPAVAPAAKRLSIAKASARTEHVARDWCDRDRDCSGSGAFNCRRLAPRRVSCIASTAGTDAAGSGYQCDRLVIVRIRRQGGLKHAAGKPRCYPT